MWGFCVCWSSRSNSFTNFLFFTMVLMLDSFILKWWAATAADLNLQYILSNSTFSGSVMTFLCLWGPLPASLVALCIGPMVLFKVYGIALNTMKNTREPQEITFLLSHTVYWRGKLLMQRWWVSHDVLSGYSYLQHELIAIASGGGWEVITVLQHVQFIYAVMI